jgi:predicted RNase H-like HicB family nuclease
MKSILSALFICLLFATNTVSSQTGVSQSKQNQMKQYSLLVRVPNDYTTQQAKEAGLLWDKLLEQWKADGVYVLSFAFPGEGYTVTGKDKEVKQETVFSGNLRAVSNIVLQAKTIEDAVTLAKACPVLTYGGKVEVREIPKPVKPTN